MDILATLTLSDLNTIKTQRELHNVEEVRITKESLIFIVIGSSGDRSKIKITR